MEDGKGNIMLAASKGLFYSKQKEKSDYITHFSTTSLLNVEGNIFSVLARQRTLYMTEHNYVDASVQKQ